LPLSYQTAKPSWQHRAGSSAGRRHNYRVYVVANVAYAAHDLVVARAELAQYKPEFCLSLAGWHLAFSRARDWCGADSAARSQPWFARFPHRSTLDESTQRLTLRTKTVSGRVALVLDCRFSRGLEVAHYNALNDAVIKSTVAASLV